MSEDDSLGRSVVLDEMLPRLLVRELQDYNTTTVAREGWTGLLNGELLQRVEAAGIDVFVTADRNMEHQQHLSGRSFGVVVVAVGGTKLEDLRPYALALREAIARVQPGQVLYIGR